MQDTDPKLALRYIEKAIEINPYLINNPIIYKPGNTPNIFQQQAAFLSCVDNIFVHMQYCYRKLGRLKEAHYWENEWLKIRDNNLNIIYYD